MKVKILGFGEIGSSLYKLYQKKNIQAAWKDLESSHGDKDCELLHVCIPFSGVFVTDILREIKEAGPSYVVIHSTVYPGTTLQVANKSGKTVVHSPVIGVHPNLAESLEVFVKWVGVTSDKWKPIVLHLNSLGMETRVIDSVESELFKLMDTTYYGLCLSLNAEMQNLCSQHGADYAKWVHYLKCYNEGYRKMEMPNVARPWFEKLIMPIGGHCIKPNAGLMQTLLLENNMPDWFTEAVLGKCKK